MARRGARRRAAPGLPGRPPRNTCRVSALLDAALTDRFVDLVVASGWTYALVGALVAADAILPLMPGEAVVIAATVLATDGDLSIALIAVAACVGSCAGDNASFAIGRGALGDAAARLMTRGDRRRRLLAWADRQLRRRGRTVVTAARFVPGGRTATTFACGAVGLRWRWFAGVDALAAALWTAYLIAVGYVGGSTFRHDALAALVVSLVAAALVAVGAELVRRGGREGPRA